MISCFLAKFKRLELFGAVLVIVSVKYTKLMINLVSSKPVSQYISKAKNKKTVAKETDPEMKKRIPR